MYQWEGQWCPNKFSNHLLINQSSTLSSNRSRSPRALLWWKVATARSLHSTGPLWKKHSACHTPRARMVCSAFHTTKAVVSQVSALRMGLQACGDIGLTVKVQRLIACLPPRHPMQQLLVQLPTKAGWHRHLAKPADNNHNSVLCTPFVHGDGIAPYASIVYLPPWQYLPPGQYLPSWQYLPPGQRWWV